MKKVLRNFVAGTAAVMSMASLAGCSVKGAVYEPGTPVKIGLICLHDVQSTYDANFINAMTEACENLGDRVLGEPIIKTGVAETKACYDAAKDLVKQGCNFIFADSFGHQDYMLQAAKKWPSVTFCHATGTNAKTAALDNYHNAFASIYEGRYLAGVAGGLRLQKDIASGKVTDADKDADGNYLLGYIGAFTYAEVISGYTSWFLGVQSVVPNVKMEVTFTGSWYDAALEQSGAQTLIDNGAVLISQHADSMGAPGACETAGVPNVSYNLELASECPKTYTSYSRINWAPYYEEVVNSLYEDRAIAGEVNNNWTGTLDTDSVCYAVKDSADAAIVDSVKAELLAGTRKVFDTSKFTVTVSDSKNANATVDAQGHLTAYQADTDGDYAGDTQVIKTEGGKTFFDESTHCSAPYFDVQIDGITLLNAKF